MPPQPAPSPRTAFKKTLARGATKLMIFAIPPLLMATPMLREAYGKPEGQVNLTLGLTTAFALAGWIAGYLRRESLHPYRMAACFAVAMGGAGHYLGQMVEAGTASVDARTVHVREANTARYGQLPVVSGDTPVQQRVLTANDICKTPVTGPLLVMADNKTYKIVQNMKRQTVRVECG